MERPGNTTFWGGVCTLVREVQPRRLQAPSIGRDALRIG